MEASQVLSERPSDRPSGEVFTPFEVGDKEFPLAVFGGLLTVKRYASLYQPMLNRDTSTDLPASERFEPPPKRGLGSVEAMQEELTDSLEALREKLGSKIFLVGHSLGGLMATLITLERPDLVAGVVSLGGVQEGIKKETPASFALRHALGNPKEAELLKHDSDFMREHKEKIASGWPEGVPLHLVGTALDYLVLPPQGFGLELPNGQKPEKRLVVPKVLGAGLAARRLFGLSPDVQTMPSKFPTEHINLPLSPVVINYVDESRRSIPAASPSPVRLRSV